MEQESKGVKAVAKFADVKINFRVITKISNQLIFRSYTVTKILSLDDLLRYAARPLQG